MNYVCVGKGYKFTDEDCPQYKKMMKQWCLLKACCTAAAYNYRSMIFSRTAKFTTYSICMSAGDSDGGNLGRYKSIYRVIMTALGILHSSII